MPFEVFGEFGPETYLDWECRAYADGLGIASASRQVMPISLPTLRSIAAAVAFEEESDLVVLGTTTTEGSASFAKVIYGHADESSDAMMMITVKRRLGREAIRATLQQEVRAYLRQSA
jgi:hypothetical protein